MKNTILVAVLFGMSTIAAADIQSANRYREIMELLGATVSVDPNYSSTEAKYTYRLNGARITCVRGITFGVFSHSCDGMTESISKRFGLAIVQIQLKNRGYEPGIVDGYFGAKTSTAIAEYQKDSGLETTGEYSYELQRALDK